MCILLFSFFVVKIWLFSISFLKFIWKKSWHIKERCLLLWPVAWGLTCTPGYQSWLYGTEYNSIAEWLRWIFCWETIPLFFCLDGCWNKMAERISGLFFLGVLKTAPLRIWHSAAEGHLVWQYSIYMPNDELSACHLIIATCAFYISVSCKTFITSYKMLYVKHQKYKITHIQKM